MHERRRLASRGSVAPLQVVAPCTACAHRGCVFMGEGEDHDESARQRTRVIGSRRPDATGSSPQRCCANPSTIARPASSSGPPPPIRQMALPGQRVDRSSDQLSMEAPCVGLARRAQAPARWPQRGERRCDCKADGGSVQNWDPSQNQVSNGYALFNPPGSDSQLVAVETQACGQDACARA